MNKFEEARLHADMCTVESYNVLIDFIASCEETEKKLNLKHRDFTCPMANTCSSLGWISDECSIKCYKDTYRIRKCEE